MNEEKKGQLFKLVDANGDGRLMYEELENLLVCTLKTAEVRPRVARCQRRAAHGRATAPSEVLLR